MKGLVLAGTHSGCGKTLITLGLLGALRKRGLRVQSFKVGPDFIDTGLHGLLTERPSINLDLWMMGEEEVRNIFRRYSEGMDVVLVEGVMGLFDGSLSTADLALFLGLPVVLVVDGSGIAQSVRAYLRGYIEEAKEHGLNLMGVIFNRLGGEGHYRILEDSIRDLSTSFGFIPKEKELEIPSRHLGLYTAEERPFDARMIERLIDRVERFLDIDRIINMAESPSAFSLKPSAFNLQPSALSPKPSMRIALVRDRAFSFYYHGELEKLSEKGSEIVEFSLLNDREIPEGVDILYIGGGYPELYASELSENISMRESIKSWVERGRPLYAECGGLIYLSKGIYKEENFYDMAGIFPFRIEMNRRPVLGYRKVAFMDEELRGHEFHYSGICGEDIFLLDNIERLFFLYDRKGSFLRREGFCYKNCLATYVHIYQIERVFKILLSKAKGEVPWKG